MILIRLKRSLVQVLELKGRNNVYLKRTRGGILHGTSSGETVSAGIVTQTSLVIVQNVCTLFRLDSFQPIQQGLKSTILELPSCFSKPWASVQGISFKQTHSLQDSSVLLYFITFPLLHWLVWSRVQMQRM